ncbi:MAG: nickel pincer cofactor biosynthesis protein LarC [Candidatus Omnitrophica bacterium]|nr:nickel pincer cofactor biosynthesis protein LarC [Candidatus Omnitrophota bacterium]
MKVAYFDCFSGVSGDMVLGAFLDLGLDIKYLRGELGKIDLKGYTIKSEKVVRHGISGTKAIIKISGPGKERTFKDISKLISRSGLKGSVKDLAVKIFRDIAEVEGRIHGKDIDKVHFHEIGAVDSIIDIAGAAIGLDALKIDAAFSSKLNLGSGSIKCDHGFLPVPAPATAALLKGMPVYSQGAETELVTPTGAAILKNISKSFGPFPEMTVLDIGYGAGDKELPIPNLLRVFTGRAASSGLLSDKVIEIETNIDDMNPELYGHVLDKLFASGALDVFIIPVYMKKTRPGNLLKVILDEKDVDKILSVIFSETTSLGVRIKESWRKKLRRENIRVKTRFGEVELKLGKTGDKVVNISPEYESARKIAIEKNIPLKTVYDEVRKIYFSR